MSEDNWKVPHHQLKKYAGVSLFCFTRTIKRRIISPWTDSTASANSIFLLWSRCHSQTQCCTATVVPLSRRHRGLWRSPGKCPQGPRIPILLAKWKKRRRERESVSRQFLKFVLLHQLWTTFAVTLILIHLLWSEWGWGWLNHNCSACLFTLTPTQWSNFPDRQDNHCYYDSDDLFFFFFCRAASSNINGNKTTQKQLKYTEPEPASTYSATSKRSCSGSLPVPALVFNILPITIITTIAVNFQ